MSRRTSASEYRTSQLVIAAVYLLMVGLFTAATAAAQETERSSVSKQYSSGGRDYQGVPIETHDQFSGLSIVGDRSRTGSQVLTQKAGPEVAAAKAQNNDFWIYAADVVLFGDDDNDGYFYGIDLLFDADTIYSSAFVYAVLYLSFDGGPWNEYTVTEDFRIDGATADDEYVVVTELQSGYPTGSYDLLIELFDADTGEFLTDYGPELNSDLGFLPVEDFNRDAPTFDRPVTVTRQGGGGGGMGVATLFVFAALLLSRRRAQTQ